MASDDDNDVENIKVDRESNILSVYPPDFIDTAALFICQNY